MKKCKGLLCLILAALLLYGCGTTEAQSGQNADEITNPEPGKVYVYSEHQYKTALMQIFSHINLTENALSVEWVGNIDQADVVITDRLDKSQDTQYRVIDTQQLPVKPMEQLLLRDQRGVIGIPLFLHLSGFWYDELLYQNADLTVPQSVETWQQCTQYPAVCEKNDADSLIWGIVVPMYLYYGGTAEELATGQLQEQPLSKALSYLQDIFEQGLLQLADDARQRFTSTQALFWLAGDQQIAASYNFMSNRSKLGFAGGLLLPANEYSQCVVRADIMLVRESSDKERIDLFLKKFFQEQTLIELSTDTQMPLACQVQYGPSVIPELVQLSYGVLSSPSVEIVYVNCGWSQAEEEALTQSIQTMINIAE